MSVVLVLSILTTSNALICDINVTSSLLNGLSDVISKCLFDDVIVSSYAFALLLRRFHLQCDGSPSIASVICCSCGSMRSKRFGLGIALTVNGVEPCTTGVSNVL